MSRHSKNNTSSSVFTYAQKQKLKGVYGTKQERISQDSIKKFQMCTLCSNRLIEPTSCDKGHMFCRSCIIEYLVKQKQKIIEHNEECEVEKKKQMMKEQQKKLEKEVEKIEKFEKYDSFLNITDRKKLLEGENKEEKVVVNSSDPKPTGMYEINAEKEKYLKTSFWAIENTPKFDEKKEKKENVVKCPGSDHKLTRKKLRDIKCKEIQSQFCCAICNKQITRQRVGAFKCGDLICHQCKSDKCEVCGVSEGWIDLECSSSSYALHQKAEVKTYTYAFYA